VILAGELYQKSAAPYDASRTRNKISALSGESAETRLLAFSGSATTRDEAFERMASIAGPKALLISADLSCDVGLAQSDKSTQQPFD
jgi:hypothetical protein